MDWANNLYTILQIIIAIAGVWYIATQAATRVNAEFEEKIITTVEKATAQIQIDANGGQSLNDVAKGLKAFRTYQEGFNRELRQDLSTLKEAVVTLENESEPLG